MWTFTTGDTSSASASQINQVLGVVEEAADYWGRYIDFGFNAIDILVNIISLDEGALAEAGPYFFLQRQQNGVDIYQAGPVLELQSDFDPNFGDEDIIISVNLDSVVAGEFYYGGVSDPDVPFSQFDLFTVLLHEIGHGLGILSFEGDPSGDLTEYDLFFTESHEDFFFTGPNAVDVYGRSVPFDDDPSHVSSLINDILNAFLSNGERLLVSALDVAILEDIGLPVLMPTSGNDALFGFEKAIGGVTYIGGDDSADLLGGNDHYQALSGDDSVSGGAGDDTLDGGDDNDFMLGNDDNDSIIGGGGNDSANGNDGDDELFGNQGDDLLVGSTGNDTIDGGAGLDVIYGGDGEDMLMGGSARDVLAAGVKNDILDGGGGRDELYGGANNDLLMGGDGNDTMFGAKGVDTLEGGDGNDIVSGAADNDFIDGGEGDDLIFGGVQNDLLTGGLGNDTFLYNAGNDIDVITDFVAGAGTEDVIELNNFGTDFDAFAEVMAAATDDGADTTINFGSGNLIILYNVVVADLHQDDFVFG
ncbi:hypothetical protein PUV54_04575 [Hyphococcus flavus]|uniref:Calcium-binding protein n=1 Tax=Hyphococcus flavus TaxID=1866326 RepID=A0AAE9ZCN7_9PROT|nr:hypothetical protein [Hyphococcus flavus]WDI32468.1 hypothetical protein PUV54_04575 [Hyphococcus flavus]